MAESQEGVFSRLKRKFKDAFQSFKTKTSKPSLGSKGKQRMNQPVYIDEPNPTEQFDDVKTKDWAARNSVLGPSTVRKVEPEDDSGGPENGANVDKPVSGAEPAATQTHDSAVAPTPHRAADDEVDPLDPAPPMTEQSAPLQHTAAAWLLPDSGKKDGEMEPERNRQISETPSMSATSGPMTESFEDLEARDRAASISASAGKAE